MKMKLGIPVVEGIVIGEAMVLDAERYKIQNTHVKPRTPEVASREFERFQKAVAGAKAEVERESARLLAEGLDEHLAGIISAQTMMYDDPGFPKFVEERIQDHYFSAEYAVSRYTAMWRKRFEAMGGMVGARVSDLDDFEQRLLRQLRGGERRKTLKNLSKPVVLIARDLTPSQTLGLPEKLVQGLATDRGGKTSHTAIIAQGRQIPAVVGLGSLTKDVTGGETIIIDGGAGKVIVDPDEATLEHYRERMEAYRRDLLELQELLQLPAETRDGHLVKLFANIEYPEEIENALAQGAEGIGLYRTEFLYEPGQDEPDEETHFNAYAKAVKLLEGRPLVIRTLDLGADKFRPEGLEGEENPFLGCRSIRYCLIERREVFEAQLRAILRVSTQGDVRLMLPMISSLEELQQAKEIIEDIKADLRREGQAINEGIPVGIMIEVPSAALMADVLARHADFFSIGTNDLVQYALAVDRGNERVADLYQPTHPAIFQLLLMTIEAARRQKIPVSICGELSGEPHFTLPLLGLGMRDLSMASASIPRIKRFIRSISAREAGRATDRVLRMEDASESLSYLRRRATETLPGPY
jgi:phosphotransferase system enzyme I (PtsI)